MESILVLNCGSSSLKFALFTQTTAGEIQRDPLLQGHASQLGGNLTGTLECSGQADSIQIPLARLDHASAIASLFSHLRTQGLLSSIVAIGHRVVHGGDTFRSPTRINAAVLQGIARFNAYAPLHNPANLLGIQLCGEQLPTLPQVAIFDTAFHGTLPPAAYHYPLPLRWFQDLGVRRYGFHGISHHYIASRLPLLLQRPAEQVRAVSAHLGNGCSLCAIRGQTSVDTSMGFSTLEGLMMGSRCGDIDPGLHEYLCTQLNIGIGELTNLLNRESGLKGVSGISNDLREILPAADAGNAAAALAIELFCYRLAKQIASYLVPLQRIDALVFTGGIGENAAPIRAKVVDHLAGLGLQLDPQANVRHSSAERNIACANTPPILLIPAREEWMIATQTAALLGTQGVTS